MHLPGMQEIEALVPGTSLPNAYSKLGRAEANHTTITILPHHTSCDMTTLQQTDPTIQEVMVF